MRAEVIDITEFNSLMDEVCRQSLTEGSFTETLRAEKSGHTLRTQHIHVDRRVVIADLVIDAQRAGCVQALEKLRVVSHGEHLATKDAL